MYEPTNVGAGSFLWATCYFAFLCDKTIFFHCISFDGHKFFGTLFWPFKLLMMGAKRSLAKKKRGLTQEGEASIGAAGKLVCKLALIIVSIQRGATLDIFGVNEDTLEWCLLLPLYFQMTLL
jgi:hypothetical protein